jgi:hypothetical protein
MTLTQSARGRGSVTSMVYPCASSPKIAENVSQAPAGDPCAANESQSIYNTQRRTGLQGMETEARLW